MAPHHSEMRTFVPHAFVESVVFPAGALIFSTREAFSLCATEFKGTKTKKNCQQGCFSSIKFQGGNISFINLGLILFYWEMFHWEMCLLFGYGSYYILKGSEF